MLTPWARIHRRPKHKPSNPPTQQRRRNRHENQRKTPMQRRGKRNLSQPQRHRQDRRYLLPALKRVLFNADKALRKVTTRIIHTPTSTAATANPRTTANAIARTR